MKPIRRILFAALLVCLSQGPWRAGAALASPLFIDCQRGDVNVAITSPGSNATVRGNVPIFGSAVVPGFRSFRIDFTTAGRDAYAALAPENRNQVVGGQLAVWNTASLPDGAYIVRLRAFDTVFQYCESSITVNVAHAAPPAPPPTEPPPPAPTDVPTRGPTPSATIVSTAPQAGTTILPSALQTDIPSGGVAPTGIPTIELIVPSSPTAILVNNVAGTAGTPGTPIQVRTPIPTSSILPDGFLDGVGSSASNFLRLMGRTFVFGAQASAGAMLIVGLFFAVRRLD